MSNGLSTNAQSAQILKAAGYGVLLNMGTRFGCPYRVWAPGATEPQNVSRARLNQLAREVLAAQA